MQDMLQNKIQVETVNFRLYYKVILSGGLDEKVLVIYFIFRQNKNLESFKELKGIKHFLYHKLYDLFQYLKIILRFI